MNSSFDAKAIIRITPIIGASVKIVGCGVDSLKKAIDKTIKNKPINGANLDKVFMGLGFCIRSLFASNDPAASSQKRLKGKKKFILGFIV